MRVRAGLGALALALTLAGPGRAGGLALSAPQMPAKARAALVTKIAKERARVPSAFERVKSIILRASEIDAQRRGQIAHFSTRFHALGRDALAPMLEALAIDAPARGDLSETAWVGLRASLIEAVGSLRAPEAEPVLVSILDRETEFYAVRAAAEALGRLGTDRAAKKLAGLAKKMGSKRLAVLDGMGDCRRLVVAMALAAELAKHPEDAEAYTLARALSSVGSAWAWQTSTLQPYRREERAVRSVAAAALLDAFIAYGGEVRAAAATALLVVDAPETPSLIANAHDAAPADTRVALDALGERLANNPAR